MVLPQECCDQADQTMKRWSRWSANELKAAVHHMAISGAAWLIATEYALMSIG